MFARSTAVLFTILASAAAQAPTITSPAVHRTRTVWFVENENPIGAEVGFAHEALAWTDETGKAFAGAKPGTRIALGAAVWAALETFTDLKFGDVAVKAGNHYAVLEKTKTGWSLGLLDPVAARKAQQPPGVAKDQKLTASIPLRVEQKGDSALRAEWKNLDGGRAELTLQFGPHTMRAEAAVAGAEKATAYSFPDARGASRVSFGKNAFAVIDHGVPDWNEKTAGEAQQLTKGRRWRLGKDWATTLDTNVPLLLGDKPLAAGSWHLTLARTDKGWNLVASSAAADHVAKLDGFAADHVTPVLEVPVAVLPLDPPADKLLIRFANEGKGTVLTIAFGKEQLTVPVAAAKT